jgi:hypothetical protein
MQSNTLAARLLPRVLAAVLSIGAAPLAVTGQTAAAPDYSGYTAAGFIPFAPSPLPAHPTQYDRECADPRTPPFTCAVGFDVSIGGHRQWYTMDTGTTGIMVSAASIPGYRVDPAKDPRGWEYLSSSKILWVGHWTQMEVTFYDSANVAVAVATVPVLAVDSEATCHHYVSTDGPRCRVPGAAPGTNPVSGLHPASPFIRYMGVGFGREDDGQPQGSPDKNPLLNITRIGGVPVRPGSMRNGYIITERGVNVGLTSANTAGFVYTPLAPMSGLTRNWGPPPMCVQVNGSRCLSGTALIDTGIDDMYISTPVPMGTVRITNPSDGDSAAALAPGVQVTVRFPGDTGQVAFYHFVVGDRANSMQPSVAMPTPDQNVFVNTGRHFYRAFNVLYDADGGYFGLRWIGTPNSPNGGTTPGGSSAGR